MHVVTTLLLVSQHWFEGHVVGVGVQVQEEASRVSLGPQLLVQVKVPAQSGGLVPVLSHV